MKENAASRLLRLAARERGKYHKARFRVFARLWSHKQEVAEPLTPYLAARFLALGHTWQLLDLNDRDWSNLSFIRSAPDELVRNYVSLAIAYMVENKSRVQRLQDIHDSCSDVLLGDDPQKIVGILGTIDHVDEQSLFVFKLQGLAKAERNEKNVVDYIRDPKNSHWVKRRLFYPLVYHTVNTPSDDYLDTFLSYMLPQDESGGTERAAVRHILRDDLSFEANLGYRAYLGLLCHPFDALESMINGVELEFSRSGTVSGIFREILNTLAEEFPTSRAFRLRLQIDNIARPADEAWPRWADMLDLPDQLGTTLQAFVQPDGACPDIDSLPTEEWKALCRMRWSRYPIPNDFEMVTAFIRSWGFTEAGRLFAACMTSMYMVSRTSDLPERRHLLRLHRAAGQTTPYLWASPRGQWLMALQARGDRRWLGADLRAGAELSRRSDANDRTWFHAVHWRLEKAERLARVGEWLAVVRDSFPVRPLYLTGIDWKWVDRVLPLTRITPFRANADGPYALLLRSVEERQRDETLLRTAIEPMTRDRSCGQFVQALIDEYGTASVAFVRFFLTPETIMLLGLAPNMTAALSERIAALEQCATAFNFGELLSEEQLRQEQQTLTSALMLLNVNANQFDIPWAAFRRDVSNRHLDTFNAYDAVRKGDKLRAILNEHDILYAHLFANGHSENYTLPSNSATLAVVILGIIDTFIDHPSYGIEAILSTRFRHDTLRREFVHAFQELEASHIQGIVPHEQREIVGALSSVALDELDAWLALRMQTRRPGLDNSLFDFAPSEQELLGLVIAAADSDGLDGVVQVVRNWLVAALDPQLARARQAFLQEFVPKAAERIATRGASLHGEIGSDPLIVQRLTSAASDTVARRAGALVEWFRMPSENAQNSLTFAEVETAVEGRFERNVIDGTLKFGASAYISTTKELSPETVRLYFDLLSEIIHNALKYARVNPVRLRISEFRDGKNWGLIYSSPAAKEAAREYDVPGHPYLSLTDALFREGNSGLEKIAALSASIVGEPVRILAERRARAFHLQIPLGTIPEVEAVRG